MVVPAEKRGVQGLATGGTGVGDCASASSEEAASTDAQINTLLTRLDTFMGNRLLWRDLCTSAVVKVQPGLREVAPERRPS